MAELFSLVLSNENRSEHRLSTAPAVTLPAAVSTKLWRANSLVVSLARLRVAARQSMCGKRKSR